MTFNQASSGAARRVAYLHPLGHDASSSNDDTAPISEVSPKREFADDGAALLASARHGREYLTSAIGPRGIQSVIGLDAAFQRTLAPTMLRAFVREELGADIGFDAGDEAFSSMIALRLFASDPDARAAVAKYVDVVREQTWRGRYRFFCDENGFAADTDCTGVAVAALDEAGLLTTDELLLSGRELLRSAAPESVPASANLDDATGKSNGDLRAGVVMVYWEDGEEPGAAPRGRKQDAAVAANALYALKLAVEAGLEDSTGVVQATLAYVGDHLRSGAYMGGTRYYPSPDTFLYYVSYLCKRFADCMDELGGDLCTALADRGAATATPGSPEDPAGALNIAQRVIAACNVGLSGTIRWDLRDLIAAQSVEGSWPAAPYYSLGKRALYFGSDAVTTMFSVKAVDAGWQATRRFSVRVPMGNDGWERESSFRARDARPEPIRRS